MVLNDYKKITPEVKDDILKELESFQNRTYRGLAFHQVDKMNFHKEPHHKFCF